MIAQAVFRNRLKNVAPSNDRDNPTDMLIGVLMETVWAVQGRHVPNAWEASFAALVLAVNPKIRMLDVAEAVPYGLRALDRVGLVNAMANLGYSAESVHTRFDRIDPRLYPCLFIPRDHRDSPGVVVGRGRVYNGGARQWKKINPRAKIEGTVIVFRRTDENMSETSKFIRAGTGHSWFRALMGRFRGLIRQIVVLGLVLNVIALATPLFIMLVYDRVISSHSAHVLPYLVAGVAAAIVMEAALRHIRARALSWLGGRLDNIVSNRIFEHLLHLAPSFIERASITSQIARVKTFESIRDFFSGPVFMSVLEMPFMIIALLFIGFIAGPLVLVPVAAAALYVLLFQLVWRRVRISIRHAAKASSARQQFAYDTFEKAEAIRADGLGTVWAQKFREVSGREAMAQFRLGWLGTVGETLANALTVLSAVAVIGFGVQMVQSGAMSTGALVATMILVWRILAPFYSLCTMVPRLEQLRNSVRQVNSLMDIDTEEMSAAGSSRIGRMKGRVTFSNAALRYNADEDPVVSGLTLDVAPGAIVAITGENGSGKTSVLKMIKGLYVPQTGSVRLDGFDIRQLDPHDIRRNIAYIPQTPDFFEGTIAENLRFGNPLANDGEIKQALGQARVLEDIIALPRGLQTMIGGADGVHLSSTLSLRLSMVRAYLQDARVLLIDEQPNSILNDEAGKFLHDTIMRHRGDQTIFVVTYREDFMSMADRIVFLRRGLPAQIGPAAEMLDRLKHMQW